MNIFRECSSLELYRSYKRSESGKLGEACAMVVPAQPMHHVELLAAVEAGLDVLPRADVGNDAAEGIFLTACGCIPRLCGKRQERKQQEKQ